MRLYTVVLVMILTLTLLVNIANASENSRELTLSYAAPASDWQSEALPIGNGRIGGMVFGGVRQEHIALNEDTLWSGEPKDWDNPDAKAWLPKVRQAIFESDFAKATELCKKLQGPFNQSYQPLGDLWIDFGHGDEAQEYRRQLDLMTGISEIRYCVEGTTYRRTSFVSFPDKVMVVHLECDKPKGLEFAVRLDSKLHHETKCSGTANLVMRGKCPIHVEPNYRGDIPNAIVYSDDPQGKGTRFQVNVCVIAEDGEVLAEAGRVQVRDAMRATILLTAATCLTWSDSTRGDISCIGNTQS